MLVNITGKADRVSIEFIASNKSLGADVNLDFVAHAV